MHLVHTAELPPEEAGYHVPDHRSVEAGKMQVFRLLPLTAGEIFPDIGHLGGLAGAVETFYYYKHIFLSLLKLCKNNYLYRNFAIFVF